MRPRLRSAWGGIGGPVTFVAAWLIGGATRRRYSPADDAISQLAAVGSSTRLLMTVGLVALAAGMLVFSAALRAGLPGPAWKAALANGLVTLGIAAFPLGASPATDRVHGLFATLGYVTLAAVPLLAARPLAGAGHRRAGIASAAIGVASGLCLAGVVLGPVPGLLQRVGLTLINAWLVATAGWMLVRR